MSSPELFGTDPIRWLDERIESSLNRWLKKYGEVRYWREPLCAVAAADDPLFNRLSQAVSPDHALPRELLPEARSVIVFFLPFQPALGRENFLHDNLAARSWAKAYDTTNRLITAINEDLQASLKELGHTAVTTPATHNFDEDRLISLWSHRHLGYIAGLGTFGHHNLLITRAGCCGRLGSLISSAPLSATPRPQEEWCLARAGRKCQACVSHCVYEALQETHFDRHRCYRQLLENDSHYSDLPLVDVCGKCGCEVPCSYQIPKPLVKTSRRC